MVKKSKRTVPIKKEPTALAERERFADWFWSPFSLMRRLDEEFETFRKNLERYFWTPSLLPSRPFWRQPPGAYRAIDIREPLTDIEDRGKELVVRAEMPGIPKENVNIKLTEDSIEINAEAKTEVEEKAKDYYHRERSYRTFYRTLPLPTEVVADKAEASLTDGILEIKLPKRYPAEPKGKVHRIKIK
jgi:HSP20 family protein